MNVLLQTAGQDAPPTGGTGMPRPPGGDSTRCCKQGGTGMPRPDSSGGQSSVYPPKSIKKTEN